MQTNTSNQVYAGFFVRLAAFLVDIIIVNAGLLMVKLPKWILTIGNSDHFLVRDFIFKYSAFDILIYLLTVTYFVLLTYFTGSTLGKKLFHLRVVSIESRKITFFEVLYRESIGRFLSSVIFCLGYLLILIEKKNRGVHDLLADTCVVYYHEKKIYVHAPVTYRNMTKPNGYAMNQQGNRVQQSEQNQPQEQKKETLESSADKI